MGWEKASLAVGDERSPQGKNAAEHTFVYAAHESAVGTARNRPEGSCGQTARTVRLTDNLDEAKAAFRAAWERPLSDAEARRLDPRELHHLAPFVRLFGDKLAEIGRRAWKDRACHARSTDLLGKAVTGRTPIPQSVDRLSDCMNVSRTSAFGETFRSRHLPPRARTSGLDRACRA